MAQGGAARPWGSLASRAPGDATGTAGIGRGALITVCRWMLLHRLQNGPCCGQGPGLGRAGTVRLWFCPHGREDRQFGDQNGGVGMSRALGAGRDESGRSKPGCRGHAASEPRCYNPAREAALRAQRAARASCRRPPAGAGTRNARSAALRAGGRSRARTPRRHHGGLRRGGHGAGSRGAGGGRRGCGAR